MWVMWGIGGCKPRIEGIDKCKYRFCTILRIIKGIRLQRLSLNLDDGGWKD